MWTDLKLWKLGMATKKDQAIALATSQTLKVAHLPFHELTARGTTTTDSPAQPSATVSNRNIMTFQNIDENSKKCLLDLFNFCSLATSKKFDPDSH